MIIYTGALALLISCSLKIYWYGFTLILVFLGGILILFLYIASIAPNEKFIKTQKQKILSLIGAALILTFTLQEWETNINLTKQESPLTALIKLYTQNITITLFIVIYLLITLLVIVKICNPQTGGPLRTNYDKSNSNITPPFKNL